MLVLEKRKGHSTQPPASAHSRGNMPGKLPYSVCEPNLTVYIEADEGKVGELPREGIVEKIWRQESS